MRRRDDYTTQYENALAVQFTGGYGMFDDPVEKIFGDPFYERNQTLILCHDCAHNLVENNPWIRKVVNDKQSHTHFED